MTSTTRYFAVAVMTLPFLLAAQPPTQTDKTKPPQGVDGRGEFKPIPFDPHAAHNHPKHGSAPEHIPAKDPAYALSKLKPADGYEVTLFASEKDFPDLQNPVSACWDGKGRLWVSTMPTYPHYLPGVEPNDKILILQDTNNDGKADTCKVFADKLYLPTGFEFYNGGVLVGLQPNLSFLKDTNGDDVADVRETVLHGLGTEDSHHAVHAFVYDPGGGLYFHEGTFHHSQVETPYGPVRLANAGSFRYVPKKQHLSVYLSYGFANPWGKYFDYWGNSFLADASGGSNYFATAMSGHVEYPNKHRGMKEFTLTKVRPTCGCIIVRNRQFPDDIQGNFILNNCIGFHGVKNWKVEEEASGFVGKEVAPLLVSSDTNFRPVDMDFGPDGALYLVDWFNPLIGHMQYSLRDPGRDHSHGRIWRIHAKGRPLLKEPKIEGAPVAQLLEMLKIHEDHTRYRARRELGGRDKKDVIPALQKWIAQLDQKDPNYEHHMLEALWAYQWQDVVEPNHLERMLTSKNPHARTGATRVLRYWRDSLPDTMSKLRRAANDPFPRVRLEAVTALSFIPTAEAAEIALEAVKHPMDYYLDYALKETLTTLDKQWKGALASGKPFARENPAAIQFILDFVPGSDLAKLARTDAVYHAMLERSGVPRENRLEAIEALAKKQNTASLEYLLNRLELLNNSNAPGLSDLAGILARWDAQALAAQQSKLSSLASKSSSAPVRQAAYAAIIRGSGSIESAWKQASGSAPALRDLLQTVPMLDDQAKQALFPRILPLLNTLPESLAAKATNGVTGRFVRIELPGNDRILSLAEVQVLSNGKNVALRQKASQSSTDHGGEAKRGVDGGTSGVYGMARMTHTNQENSPWWEVDLGQEYPIDSVTIWNRTEENFGKRLDGFTLSVLDNNRQPVAVRTGVPAPAEKDVLAMTADAQGMIRQAALEALPKIGGHEAELFTAIAPFVAKENILPQAVKALRQIDKARWPAEPARELATTIADLATKATDDQRDDPAFNDLLVLGKDAANALPQGQRRNLLASMNRAAVVSIKITAVPSQMRFDKTTLSAQPGQRVHIVFTNPDEMPHNLLLIAPGSLNKVGNAAEAMAGRPDGFARNFVPDLPEVLVPSKLIQPGETYTLKFTAPAKEGDYPYVCTFPGHWLTMNGILKVTPAK